MYRLSADWGYPVGPKGKTRCACKACFRRADSAYFTTKAAAIEGRIHPCCVCQPYRTTIAGIPSTALFAGESSADIRDPRVAAVFAAVPTGVPAGESPTTGSSDPFGLDPASTPTSSHAEAGSSLPAAAMGFARTGSTMRLPLIGAALTAVGGALIAFRSRGTAGALAHRTPEHHRDRQPRRPVMNIGPTELLIVLAIVLLIFGSTKIPQLARSMGEARKEFTKGHEDIV